MIVEDDDATREAFSLILALSGYRVQTATNGRSALEQLRSSDRPSLIVLDLMMPIMDGAELRQHLAQDERLANIPILVCSAVAERDRVQLANPPAAFLRKPIDPQALLAAVQRHCLA